MQSILGPILGFALLVVVLGGAQWAFPALGHRRRAWRLDLAWWFFTPLVAKPAVRFLTILALLPLVALLGRPFDETAAWGAGPLAELPAGVQVLAVVLLLDLVSYWMHRLHHRSPLWRTHAIHHSSEHLDWLSAVRTHPLNALVQRLPGIALVLVLGFDLRVIAGVAPALGLYAVFLHADVPFRWGPLRYVVASPAFHRWHHDRSVEGGCNFAGLLPLWDLIFGTFWLPEEQPRRFGVTGARPPERFWGQLLWPLRWSTEDRRG